MSDTVPVDIWLRGQDFATTRSIGGVTRDAAVWTDQDVRLVLEGMLREMHRLKHPGDESRPVNLRGLSWIVNPYDEGGVVIAIEIREAGPDGFLTVARNVTDLRLMGMSIAAPGDLAAMTWVRRVGPDSFEYYALNAMALNRLAAALTPDSVHVNRAVASYRYLAGIPTDRDPPAALK